MSSKQIKAQNQTTTLASPPQNRTTTTWIWGGFRRPRKTMGSRPRRSPTLNTTSWMRTPNTRTESATPTGKTAPTTSKGKTAPRNLKSFPTWQNKAKTNKVKFPTGFGAITKDGSSSRRFRFNWIRNRVRRRLGFRSAVAYLPQLRRKIPASPKFCRMTVCQCWDIKISRCKTRRRKGQRFEFPINCSQMWSEPSWTVEQGKSCSIHRWSMGWIPAAISRKNNNLSKKVLTWCQWDPLPSL